MAASCFAAGDATVLPCDDVAAVVAAAAGVASPAGSLAIVAGLDNGEGLSVRLTPSADEPLGGMFDALSWSLLVDVSSAAGEEGLLVETVALRLEDCTSIPG
jgi:hypothetical protein